MEYTILILLLPLLSFLFLGLAGMKLKPVAAGLVGTAVLGVIAAVWAIAQAKKVAKRNAAAANAATACFNIVDFAPRTAQIILIVICRDMRVTNYSLRGARVAAASRAARHEAQRIPLKRRHSRLFKYSKTRDSVPRF